MHIERHIFGSYSGYTTMAKSPGVSTEDCRLLEAGAYGFGQCNDRAFTRQLAKHPAYFTRLCGGGRRGLTRVLEGQPDDNQRPTLRLITVLVPQRDWDVLLWGDVLPLLEHTELWTWDGTPHLPAIEWQSAAPSRTMPRKSVPKVLALLAEVERNFAVRRTVSVAADEYGQAELRAVEMLIPPLARRQFVSSYRSLSTQMPVSVNCLAVESGAHPTFRYQPEAPAASAYTQFLGTTDLPTGVIPVDQVAEYKNFGAVVPAGDGRPVSAPVAAPRAVAAKSGLGLWPVVLTAVLGVMTSVGSFFGGAALGIRQESDQARSHYAVEIARATVERATADEEKLQQVTGVAPGTYDEMLAAVQKKLRSAESAAKPVAPAAPPVTMPRVAPEIAREHDRLRDAYAGLARLERNRFLKANAELQAQLPRINLRTIGELVPDITRLAEELKGINDDWPLLPDEQQAWLAELKEARGLALELVEVGPKISSVNFLLENCEEARRQFREHPVQSLGEIGKSLEALRETLGKMPRKLIYSHMDIASYRQATLQHMGALRMWVDEKTKPAGSSPGGKT